jgi:hypothetical protein
MPKCRNYAEMIYYGCQICHECFNSHTGYQLKRLLHIPPSQPQDQKEFLDADV